MTSVETLLLHISYLKFFAKSLKTSDRPEVFRDKNTLMITNNYQ